MGCFKQRLQHRSPQAAWIAKQCAALVETTAMHLNTAKGCRSYMCQRGDASLMPDVSDYLLWPVSMLTTPRMHQG